MRRGAGEIRPAAAVNYRFSRFDGRQGGQHPRCAGSRGKTAQALLSQLGNLDAVYARLDEVAGLPIRGAKSLAEKLREHEPMARLSYQLATIKPIVNCRLACRIYTANHGCCHLKTLYERMEFKSWIKELAAAPSALAEVATDVGEEP